MEIKEISPFLSVSPQLSPADVGIAASLGYRTVINNRPDHESGDQPAGAEIQAAAERHGLEYRAIPVVSGKITDADADTFTEALKEVQGPVLAFCRSGTRSAILWALSEARHLTAAAILKAAERAGYNLESLGPRLEARSEASKPAEPSGGGGR
ncbi:MAG TPA: TIGR01244 family sulfur transferase [Alphaproteobacteria bacterium]|nr:TIGR01244 family sulfur transferase [Alphaproteobacteria bacterium]